MTVNQVLSAIGDFIRGSFDDININYKNENKNLNVTVNNPTLGGNVDIKMIEGKPVVNISVGGKPKQKEEPLPF